MPLVTVGRVQLHVAKCPPLTNIFEMAVRAGNGCIAMLSPHTCASSRAVAGRSGRYRGVPAPRRPTSTCTLHGACVGDVAMKFAAGIGGRVLPCTSCQPGPRSGAVRRLTPWNML